MSEFFALLPLAQMEKGRHTDARDNLPGTILMDTEALVSAAPAL
jgi:hypothetical protein